ncbi:MAG: response regulator [Anaerolineae bacterium]|nr:response regulator [Anaerolineae bacterium]
MIRYRILVIGQHGALRLTLCGWLEAILPTVHTIVTGNVTVGIALTQSDPPAMIIIDAGFPKMHSLEVIARLKEAAPDMPLLVLTTYPLDNYREQTLAAGATACVPKSLIYEEQFIPLVTKMLSSSPSIDLEEVSYA